MSDRVIIEVQKAGVQNVQVLPMGEGSPLYKIIRGGRVIAENLSRQAVDAIIQKASSKVILG